MIIEIKNDILDKVVEGNKTFIDCMILLACASRKEHYVIMPDWNTYPKQKEVTTIMGVRLFDKLKIISKNAENIKNFKFITPILGIKAICTTSKNTQFIDKKNSDERINTIILNPNDIKDFKYNADTVVLGENINDIYFYENLIKYYIRNNNKVSNRIGYNFRPEAGGGVTTVQTVKNYIDKKSYFCITIADSDKKYDTCDIGDTAEQISDIYEKEKPFNSWYYILRYVSEIENLLPKKILTHLNNKDKNLVTGKDYSYFDLKKGLTEKVYANSDAKKYWDSIFGQELNNRISNRGKEAPIISGFGSKCLSNLTKEQKQYLSKVTLNDLSDSQKKEWYELGKILLGWTCCYPSNWNRTS